MVMKMNLTDGLLYFNKEKIKYKYEYLNEDTNTDILIIGAGITGAITAYYFLEKGYKVTMIEKNIVGYGSTSVTTAIMEYQIDEDIYKLKKQIGLKETVKCYKMCLKAIDEIEKIIKFINKDVKFKRQDSLYISNKKIILKEYKERKKYFNVNLELNKLPKFKYAINLKNASAVMNPYLFTTELINKLTENNNFKIYENTKCIKINKSEIITNNKFKIKYKKCILTTGFDAIKNIKSTTKLYKTFAIITEKLNINYNFTARDINNPYHYIRFDDNRIIFGGEDIKINKYNKKTEIKAYNNLKKDFKKYFPQYKNKKIKYKFNGTFANTKDTLPIIDKIKNNVYCNLGYGANVILYSVIGAKLLSNNKINKLFKIR